MCSSSFALDTDCLPAGNQSLLKRNWSIGRRKPESPHPQNLVPPLQILNIHVFIEITLTLPRRALDSTRWHDMQNVFKGVMLLVRDIT